MSFLEMTHSRAKAPCMLALLLLSLQGGCAHRRPHPPTQQELQEYVTQHGASRAYSHYRVKVRGNPFAKYKMTTEGKTWRREGASFLSESPESRAVLQPWKHHTGTVLCGAGLLLYLGSGLYGGATPEVWTYEYAMLSSLVLLGFTTTAALFLVGYESDVPAAASAYNRALRADLNMMEAAATQPDLPSAPTSEPADAATAAAVAAAASVPAANHDDDAAEAGAATAPAASKPWSSVALVARVESELLLEGISLARLDERLSVESNQSGGWVIRLEHRDRPPWTRIVTDLDDNIEVAAAQVVTIVAGLLRSRGGDPAGSAEAPKRATGAPDQGASTHNNGGE